MLSDLDFLGLPLGAAGDRLILPTLPQFSLKNGTLVFSIVQTQWGVTVGIFDSFTKMSPFWTDSEGPREARMRYLSVFLLWANLRLVVHVRKH